jgi:hypothetical protein
MMVGWLPTETPTLGVVGNLTAGGHKTQKGTT